MPRSMQSMTGSVSIGGLTKLAPPNAISGSTFQKLPNTTCPGVPGGTAPGQRTWPSCVALSPATERGDPQVKLTTSLGALDTPVVSDAVARQNRLVVEGVPCVAGGLNDVCPFTPPVSETVPDTMTLVKVEFVETSNLYETAPTGPNRDELLTVNGRQPVVATRLSGVP